LCTFATRSRDDPDFLSFVCMASHNKGATRDILGRRSSLKRLTAEEGGGQTSPTNSHTLRRHDMLRMPRIGEAQEADLEK